MWEIGNESDQDHGKAHVEKSSVKLVIIYLKEERETRVREA